MGDRTDNILRVITSKSIPLEWNTPIRKSGTNYTVPSGDGYDKKASYSPRYVSTTQRNLLERVAEKGYEIDRELASYCAYYPLFKFVRFEDKKTGDIVQGQQLVCKDCTRAYGNKKCSHNFCPDGLDSRRIDRADKVILEILGTSKPKVILRKGTK